MKSSNHERIQRPKQQPHAALLIILMSSICKLPKTLTDIAAGNLATAILSSLLLHLQNIYRTTDRIRHHHSSRHHYHNQHNNNSNSNSNKNNSNSNQNNQNSNSINSQHAQIQQSSPSHERIVVKPNLLATNLVNTLMISLYITLFVSLSIYPVSVVAVSKYKMSILFHSSEPIHLISLGRWRVCVFVHCVVCTVYTRARPHSHAEQNGYKYK